MIWNFLYFIEPVIYIYCIITILYLLVFAIASVKNGDTWTSERIKKNGRFLFITTACQYDTSIEKTIKSILSQDYDRKNFDVIVVGDNLSPLMNMKLAQYPITYIKINMENGSKIKALQQANKCMSPLKIYDLVILIDPDETIGTGFLEKINKAYQSGYRMIQLHRTDIRRNTYSKVLATTFDEINNSIFRIGHNNMGLSSALVGSGLCLEYKWFRENIDKLSTEDEEKEMEIYLLKEQIYVDYLDDIHVYVDYMNSTKDFNAQRRRWTRSQWRSLKHNIKYFFPALYKGNYDLANKIFQWILIPRIILVGIIFLMSCILPFIYISIAIKWWLAALLILFVFAVATPDYLVDKNWTHAFRFSPFIILSSFISFISLSKIKKIAHKA